MMPQSNRNHHHDHGGAMICTALHTVTPNVRLLHGDLQLRIRLEGRQAVCISPDGISPSMLGSEFPNSPVSMLQCGASQCGASRRQGGAEAQNAENKFYGGYTPYYTAFNNDMSLHTSSIRLSSLNIAQWSSNDPSPTQQQR